MDVRCIRVKLKKEYLSEIYDWFRELNDRKNEVLETLKAEGIIVESAFIDQHENNFYLIYYVKAIDLQKALNIFQCSTKPIDIFYKECWKKFCGEVIDLKPILDVDILDKILCLEN